LWLRQLRLKFTFIKSTFDYLTIIIIELIIVMFVFFFKIRLNPTTNGILAKVLFLFLFFLFLSLEFFARNLKVPRANTYTHTYEYVFHLKIKYMNTAENCASGRIIASI